MASLAQADRRERFQRACAKRTARAATVAAVAAALLGAPLRLNPMKNVAKGRTAIARVFMGAS